MLRRSSFLPWLWLLWTAAILRRSCFVSRSALVVAVMDCGDSFAALAFFLASLSLF
jgi:hypothetical protein